MDARGRDVRGAGRRRPPRAALRRRRGRGAGAPGQAARASRDGRRARELEYQLSIGLDLLGPLPVDQVDERAVEDMVDALIDQRLAIEPPREHGRPLTEDYIDARTGRTHRRRRRGLSNSTINLAIGAHQRVLRYAHRQRLIDRLPDLSECRPARPAAAPLATCSRWRSPPCWPPPTRIEAERRGLDWEKVRHIRASTASARGARARARRLGHADRQGPPRRALERRARDAATATTCPRRAIIEALLLLGPRVSELCGWLGHDVDLAGRRVRDPPRGHQDRRRRARRSRCCRPCARG